MKKIINTYEDVVNLLNDIKIENKFSLLKMGELANCGPRTMHTYIKYHRSIPTYTFVKLLDSLGYQVIICKKEK